MGAWRLSVIYASQAYGWLTVGRQQMRKGCKLPNGDIAHHAALTLKATGGERE